MSLSRAALFVHIISTQARLAWETSASGHGEALTIPFGQSRVKKGLKKCTHDSTISSSSIAGQPLDPTCSILEDLDTIMGKF